MTTTFMVKNWRNRPNHIHSSPWHSKIQWNIAIPISTGSPMMTSLHHVKLGKPQSTKFSLYSRYLIADYWFDPLLPIA